MSMLETPAPSVTPPEVRGLRWRWLVPVGAVALVGGAAGLFAVIHHSSSDAIFSPTTHLVSYEVTGQGSVPDITYSADNSGNLQMVMNPKLPWRKTVTIPVGLTAGNANVESGNAYAGQPDGAAPIVCRIWVDGKLVAQRNSADGFSDAACSTTLMPKQG
jgi:hypothetical protein